MQSILSVAIIVVLITSLFIVLRWRNLTLSGSMPVSLFAFIAILFTSGLDVGLIMFPLTEFPVYASEAPYSFTNPLAIMFGCWGFLIWTFYFLTTFYFCVVEPKVKLFELRWVKFINNIIIIGTCAFTGFLFLKYLPSYIHGITPLFRYGLVAIVVLCAVFSSTNVRYVKILSISSTLVFYALIAGMWSVSGMGFEGMGANLLLLADYFTNLPAFVTPMTDYHAFYLFWWFSWSIMIGQFVARFVNGLRTWQLLLALLIFPSIPLALWFSVLYFYSANSMEVGAFFNFAMILVGTVFVINSLDSLTRLYTQNLGLTVERLGQPRYMIFNWVLLFSLILLYQLTPLKIEWIGLIIIGLYAVIYGLLLKKRHVFLRQKYA